MRERKKQRQNSGSAGGLGDKLAVHNGKATNIRDPLQSNYSTKIDRMILSPLCVCASTWPRRHEPEAGHLGLPGKQDNTRAGQGRHGMTESKTDRPLKSDLSDLGPRLVLPSLCERGILGVPWTSCVSCHPKTSDSESPVSTQPCLISDGRREMARSGPY